MTTNYSPICMTEEYWANSYFSIARHYGGINFGGHEYSIVNKQGMTVAQISLMFPNNDMAIPPGEPADLLRNDFIPLYKKLGRETFINILANHQRDDDKTIKKLMREIASNKQKP